MAQHFLLSSRARTLDLCDLLALNEEEARARFTQLRWPETNGKPVCPVCGCVDHWVLREGAKWKCKGCRLQFTATTTTPFHAHKLPFRKLLAVVALFSNGVNGVAACRLAREVKISYKAAFVLLHKIREAMGGDEEASKLSGVVEMDGAVFGGKIGRMPNRKENWAEFLKEHKAAARKRKKLIVVIRERPGDDPDVPDKVRTFLVGKEGDAVEIARQIVMPGTIVHADRGTQWEPLHMYFKTYRIDHSKSFSDGIACTNLAESFFGRMRTGERGVHKHIGGVHITRYAMEFAWREQYRRKSNGDQVARIIGAIGRMKRSSTFLGYWRARPGNDNEDPFAFAA